ncbi:unnamed protein product [Bursaphelenchus xylophilus]|uniref:(pine wood nematode) hypothetical protein n=1 Tax=Bursaphelenchus xylophilus TaxID=6326 RepID=A0A7I8WJE0_BURXY|nr:unnamed protein product [Bursaphelenchus xylophilus]CAG9108156.1 unnamed protein product [Bursaphelenchus xylophilus]
MRWIFQIVFLSIFGISNSLSDSDGTTFPVDSISHAFVQTDSELHYFRDTSSKELWGFAKPPDLRADPPGQPLELVPGKLDFGEGHLGIPRRLKVTIVNPNSFEVKVHAISTVSQDFYYTFPATKIIQPSKNVTITVTFLPRNEDLVESVLSIYISHSIISLEVTGRTTGNPYRLKHQVEARVPFKGSLDFPINLHNPYSEKLRISRIISSDKSVVLTSTGENVTELIPFETRRIGDMTIVGGEVQNSTVFVMIKAETISYDSSEGLKSFDLVIAVDLEVTRQLGIFSTVDVIDFGLIKYGDRSERKVFEAFTNVDNGLEVESIYVVKNEHPNYGLYMQYASKPPISVRGGTRNIPGKPVPIANVHLDTNYFTLNASQQLHRVNGEIVAESRGGNYNVTVKFTALIVSGGISQVMKDSSFYIKLKPPVVRTISLNNEYPFGLGNWDVTLEEEDKKTFSVKLISPVVEIAPNETKPALLVTYLSTPEAPKRIDCVVASNVTAFKVQLLVFEGNIKIEFPYFNPEKDRFDLGEITKGERRSFYFTIINSNPVALMLKKLTDPWPGHITVDILSSADGNSTRPYTLDKTNFQWEPGLDVVLPAQTFTVFNLTVFSNGKVRIPEDLHIRLQTEFEDFVFPIEFKFTEDSLKSLEKQIDLGESFPGKVTTKEINVFSSSKLPLRIMSMSTLTDDPRFAFSIGKGDDLTMPPESVKALGSITFTQGTACTNDCYCGFTIHSPDGQWFTHGMKLPPNLPEIDSYLYQRLRMRWNAITDKTVQSKVIIDTDRFRSVEVGVKTELSWPKLFSHRAVHFPLTAVGNFTILNLTLANPSIHPVIVQLLPLVIYPDAEALLEFFKDELPYPLTEPVEMNETLMFSLRDTELFTLKPGSPVPRLREEVEQVVNRQVPRFTLSMILKPGMKVRIRVGFLPSDYTLRSSLLLIRNNLTALEPVVLYGRGSRVGLEMDGKSSREVQLMFDILMSHLSECYNPKRLTHKLGTSFTVKRTFFLKNVGESELWIVNMSISGTSCSDRGFRVLNCDTFILAPNETKPIDIAYTPDFLMSVNEATLQVYTHMNATPWVFDIVATIAPEMLEICHAALPRPPFEWLMYYACVMALVFCMVCISACAYLEGDRCLSGMQHQQVELMNELHHDPLSNSSDYTDLTVCSDRGFFWRLRKVTGRKHEEKFRWVYQSTDNCLYVLFARMFNCFIFVSERVWWVIRGDVVKETNKELFNNEKLNSTIRLMDDVHEAPGTINVNDKYDEAENSKATKNGVRRRRNANKKKTEAEIVDLNNKEPKQQRKEKLSKQDQEVQKTDSTKSSDSMHWKHEFEMPEVHKFDDQCQNNDESTSPPPEWADAVINSDDIQKDFEFYAQQCGSLFADVDQHSPSDEVKKEAEFREYEENDVTNTSWLTPSVINRLVEEFREKLLRIASTNPVAGDTSVPLPSIILEEPVDIPVPDPLNGITSLMDTTYFENSQGNNIYDQLLQFQQETQRNYDLHRHLLYQGYANPIPNEAGFQFPWFIQQENLASNNEDQGNGEVYDNGYNALFSGNEAWHPKKEDKQDWPDNTKPFE